MNYGIELNVIIYNKRHDALPPWLKMISTTFNWIDLTGPYKYLTGRTAYLTRADRAYSH